LTVSIISAGIGLIASLGVAYWLLRRQLDRAAFAAVVAAPVIAGLAFAATGATGTGAAPAASPASTTAAPAAPVAAEPSAPAAPAATVAPPPAPAAGGGLVDGLRREAEEARRTKHFAEAKEIYAKITRMAPFDADAWADLGDASAAAAGGDLKAGVQAIDRALEIEPRHPKSLWLKASLELQEKRYSSAADLWQRLLGQLEPTSNDAQIVRANLEETRTLAARQGAGR
jgi:cytochrome c-type biogenesis protein CcmH